MRRFFVFLAFMLMIGQLAGRMPPAHAATSASELRPERVNSLARFQGVRANSLVGYGLVVGLPGTGDDNLAYTIQSVRSATSALGMQLPDGIKPSLKNAAAVMITAELPPFAKPGQRIDVTISALGKAKSLRGGTLLLAPLRGVDSEVYALAQGNLTVGGFGADGADGSRVVVNTPTSGRIPGGALVEREVPSPFSGSGPLLLDLALPSFTNAEALANGINMQMGRNIARPMDAVTVEIDAPDGASDRVRLASRIERMLITPAKPPARVVVNARTGTVVVSGDVRILPAAITHGNLTVTVREDWQVSQPAPFSRGGETTVTPRSNVETEEDQPRMAMFAPGVQLSDIVDAVNALGAAPGDLVAILEALKEVGALRAELVVI